MFKYLRKLLKLDEDSQFQNDVLEFQSDKVEIENQPPPPYLKWTAYTMIGLLVVTVIYTSIAEVDRIIIASGKLVNAGQDIIVKPMFTSTVRKLNVQIGNVVKAGQVLVSFDPTNTESDVGQLKVRIDGANIQIKRLESELDEKPFDPPKDSSPEDVKIQTDIYTSRVEEYASRMKSYDSAISETKSAMEAESRHLAQLRKQLEKLSEMMEMRRQVYLKGADSKLSFLEAERQQLSLNAEVEKLTQTVQERRHTLDKITSDKSAFTSQRKSEIGKELSAARKDRDTMVEQLAKAERLNQFVDLTAPVDAVVQEIGKIAVGTSVKDGEPIITLVPLNVPLEAEVSISASDIGYVRVGDQCRIKLEAYPFQKHGTLEGELKTISEDAFEVKTPVGTTLSYRARITLTKTKLHKVSPDFRLLPGFSMTGEIKVGKRSVISYFLWPLLKTLDESLRTP